MQERIKEIIIELLTQRNDKVSFAGIERILEQKGIRYQGDHSIHMPSNKSVRLWVGMSEDFCKAVVELMFKDCTIIPRNVPSTLYIFDGKIPDYPVAGNLHPMYETERWFPIAFSLRNLYEEGN
ncbi:hypothetical protein ACS78_25820 [Priestia megaterium]|uniref:hypothetical protein n=1 Tax=Priestia megaterium TaxID=1404 RepID=UPI000681824B|nr:hypothetical protein [Priestia megaterium]KNH16152.1 hypothetical protein ACS78_25820 [Priestia megaterium]